MGIVGHAAELHPRVLLPGKEEKLLNLMGTDVAKDAAILFLFKEPLGPPCRAQAVRPKPVTFSTLPMAPWAMSCPAYTALSTCRRSE